MNKVEEGWREIKAYLDYCFGRIPFCNAMKYNSTSGYLQPFIDIIETELKRLEELDKANIKLMEENTNLRERPFDFYTDMEKKLKALEIIKTHPEQLLDIIDTDNYNEYLDLDYAPSQYIAEKDYLLIKEVLL